MKIIKMKFVTDAGNNLYVTMNYASPELEGASGPAAVKAAAGVLIAQQPFTATLASLESAEVIETTTTAIDLSAE